MIKKIQLSLLSFFIGMITMPAMSFAEGIKLPGILKIPEEARYGFQEPVSLTAVEIQDFHTMLLWITGGIVAFVSLLLVYVVLRFNEKANPVPAKFTHNWTLEIAWITIPTLIVLFIALYSMRLLYFQDLQQEPDMRIHVTGYQWYWGYKYPDHGDIEFMSYMIADEDIDRSKGERRLLSTDTKVVLPIDTTVQILVDAGDVIHSWAMPALGIKIDAVPGHLNETWVNITKPGVYYGQCSELCGKDHTYMPIEVHAVTKPEFNKWVIAQGGKLQIANSHAVAK